MSFAKRLNTLKSNWKDSQAVKGTGGALPVGKYQFKIEKAMLEEGKLKFNKNHILVVYHLVVAVGPLKGRKAFIRVDLESDGNGGKYPTGMSIFKGHLETLKLDMPKQLTEPALKELLGEMAGMIFDGACTHNAKGYANIYINGLVNAPNEEEDDEDEDEDEEDKSEDEEDDEEEDDESDDEDDEDEEDDEEEPAKPVKGKAKDEEFKVKPTGKKAATKKTPAKKQEEEEDDDEDEDDEDDEEWDDDFEA